ncbi:MAG: response regulator [Gammaproteobacteria bacterium]|nr:response regulator [Gammaproteobacteria bacterium]
MATILIIEDSATDTLVLRKMLERHGFDVVTATHGQQGIDMATEQSPDLILMDIVMPGVNGFQATRQLQKQEQTASIPVIIITTKDQETDRIWGLRQGAREFLVKPVSEKALVDCVRSCLLSAETD